MSGVGIQRESSVRDKTSTKERGDEVGRCLLQAGYLAHTHPRAFPRQPGALAGYSVNGVETSRTIDTPRGTSCPPSAAALAVSLHRWASEVQSKTSGVLLKTNGIATSRPVLRYLHGTVAERDQCPGCSDVHAAIIVLVYAGTSPDVMGPPC